jgi:hypothetical protein
VTESPDPPKRDLERLILWASEESFRLIDRVFEDRDIRAMVESADVSVSCHSGFQEVLGETCGGASALNSSESD